MISKTTNHESETLRFQNHAINGTENNHITELITAPDYVPSLAFTLLELFTHEQLAELRCKFDRIHDHMEEIRSDRDLCRAEVYTYKLNSIYGEIYLCTHIQSINSMFSNLVEFSIEFADEHDHENGIYVDIWHEITRNSAAESNSVVDGMKLMVTFLNSLYNMTELRAPEETRSQFLEIAGSLEEYWRIDVREDYILPNKVFTKKEK